MNAQQTSIARSCLAASHDGTMDFPTIVGTLIAAGFEGYAVDYRRGTSTYYLPDGDSVELPAMAVPGPVAAAFRADAIEAAVREAQANSPGYSYRGFCETVRAAGCAGYMVSFLGRRVVYYGRTAESHVEHFPH
ncbi:hypothetical protein VY88_25600 [Azospirillum thiophilum]|uniref:DUF1398 domain-containing protein n=1 Tax=Azospirillum thiophilum TaxID=528244 RepID=A0AAC8W4F0_9PROT|nr:DUF1398 family protein [Azospirillum thiophilum]ALG74944.1 hypothetical protein AL072_28520 [Azospirillum thiophilum]KJR62332.1 hypothetical protein VY88_25600 [Azospirillum thiophilum]